MTAGIRRIQATNYRCLRNVDVELDQFHVLVGANGSGKSTLFDAIRFTRDLLLLGIDAAVDQRTSNFRDLVWGRPARDLGFELAFELDIPQDIRELIPRSYDRFAITLSIHEADGGNLRAALKGRLKQGGPREDAKTNGSFIAGAWSTEMQFDSADPFRQPVAYENPHVSDFVTGTFLRVGDISLENRHLRRATAPARLSNPGYRNALPSLVSRLMQYPDRYDAWQQHVRTAIPDIRDVRVETREDDRHSYVVAVYGDELKVPSWAMSDGTLRLLALTIIAYLPEDGRAYLIEEPENGIHPLAVEAVYRSLSSAYRSQILVTTHSPVLLACTEPKELLCFAKRDGETQVTRGDKHPHLAHWQSAADVDLLFASEVLG